MDIKNCLQSDTNTILSLYESARQLQIAKKMVVWPPFSAAFIEKEIDEKRQWKLSNEQQIVCNWAITFQDPEIWETRDKDDAIYIHRICTHPLFRGNRYIDTIVTWAKQYATTLNKQYVRLDTLGNNTNLIKHYTSAGFQFLGMFELTNTQTLPKHYQDEPNCCLFEINLWQ
jgi:ribosomal protein S18 acetylase RimI-like enzyme